jgi:hypothetical protein
MTSVRATHLNFGANGDQKKLKFKKVEVLSTCLHVGSIGSKQVDIAKRHFTEQQLKYQVEKKLRCVALVFDNSTRRIRSDLNDRRRPLFIMPPFVVQDAVVAWKQEQR